MLNTILGCALANGFIFSDFYDPAVSWNALELSCGMMQSRYDATGCNVVCLINIVDIFVVTK